jgi:hypothetical protein
MAELIVMREQFGFVYTILPKVSIPVSDLPKTGAIDYIVDVENRHKVWYRKKYSVAMEPVAQSNRTIETSAIST